MLMYLRFPSLPNISNSSIMHMTISPPSTSSAALAARRPLASPPDPARSRRGMVRMNASVAASTFAAEPISAGKATSLYEILRVEQTASQTEIKTAYRSLAKVYHPDAATAREEESDGRDFIEIHSAYETLSDPTARALYDLSLAATSSSNCCPCQRRWRRRPVGFTGGYHPTRRWETDQCW